MALNAAALVKVFRKIARDIVSDSQKSYDAYKAGLITREEWHRQDLMAVYYDTDDGESKSIRKKLSRERQEAQDKRQLAAMEFDIQRGRGDNWKNHRLWNKRKENNDD